jgi:hypothetical protein
MKPKTQWRPQKAGGTGNMECLQRKAAGSKQSQPTKEDMWFTTGQAMREGLPKSLGDHVMSQITDMGLQDLMFALLGFSLALVPSPFLCPYSCFLEWEYFHGAVVYWRCITFSKIILQTLTAKSLVGSQRKLCI